MVNSSAVEVRPHAHKGRGLYASRAFQPGQVILGVTPLLLIPERSHLSKVCTHCMAPGKPQACTRCRAAYYCNQTCQRAHWKTIHGKECKPLQRAARELPTPVRAMLQVLVDDRISAAVEPLDGQIERIRTGPTWGNVQLAAMAATTYSGKGTEEDHVRRAAEIFCKIQTNAFHRMDVDLGHVGIFLEPTLAMANHSCIPNATVQFSGNKAVLRASAPIKSGQEIEISYTDFTDPLSKRKEALAAYGFECQCPRCTKDLNVYQVCAESPPIKLNEFSLVPNLASKVKANPAVSDPAKCALARDTGEALAHMINDDPSPDSLPERRAELRAQLRKCRSLVDNDFWAISPLPAILMEISIYYSEKGSFAQALATACFVATRCDPYRYVAPFDTQRAKHVFMIAKLFMNTATDTWTLLMSPDTAAPVAGVERELQEYLKDLDQVSVCQMLLIMVLKSAPASLETEWDLNSLARPILDDIEGLPGREEETPYIHAWRDDPTNEHARAFFDYAVVQNVEKLAVLGRAVLKADFET